MLRRRALAAALLTAAVCATAAAPASAGCRNVWTPNIGEGGGSLTLLCDNPPQAPSGAKKSGSGSTKSKAKKKAAAKAPTPTKAQYRAMRFASTPEVSAKVQAAFVAIYAKGQYENEIRAEIESGLYLTQFHDHAKEVGYRTDDLADAYSQAYATLWVVVNNRPNLSDDAFKAARATLRPQLALDKRLRARSDAWKQEYAERLAHWTAILTGTWNFMRKNGSSPVALEKLAQDARGFAKDDGVLGVDLTKVKLTKRGVQPR